MHLFGYLYEDYHDARSLEYKEKEKVYEVRNKFSFFRITEREKW